MIEMEGNAKSKIFTSKEELLTWHTRAIKNKAIRLFKVSLQTDRRLVPRRGRSRRKMGAELAGIEIVCGCVRCSNVQYWLATLLILLVSSQILYTLNRCWTALFSRPRVAIDTERSSPFHPSISGSDNGASTMRLLLGHKYEIGAGLLENFMLWCLGTIWYYRLSWWLNRSRCPGHVLFGMLEDICSSWAFGPWKKSSVLDEALPSPIANVKQVSETLPSN